MIKKISQLLEQKKYNEVKQLVIHANYVDLAETIEEMEDSPFFAQLFRIMSKEQAAEVFSEMNSDLQEKLIQLFTDEEVKNLLNEMYVDDTVDMLEEMPANVVERLLGQTDIKTRNRINQILQYPEDSVGTIMTIEYIDLKKEMTVAQALSKIRRVGIDQETIYTCYVIEQKRLIGIVTAKQLLLNPEDTLIGTIMETNVIKVHTHDDQELAGNLIHRYGLIALPVVDVEECMVGIVTFDDAMDVLQEEIDEDIAMMGAMTPNEQSYFKTSVFEHARHRIVWLLFLMLSATITGAVITNYQSAFEALPDLVSFIPMLMGTGGNCGSQSSTLVIRGIAVDEIEFKDIFKVMRKEIGVALVVGIALALINGVRILIFYHDVSLAILLSFSLIATITIAKFIGCSLPLFAKKIGLDPAIMAAPLISTIVDTCSVLIYFAIATQLYQL